MLKSFLTDNGFALASDALQVFGGHGYTHDWGIEQCLRDARIAMIYEGTNQIQAIDLVVRKLVTDGGRAFAARLETLAASLPRGHVTRRRRPGKPSPRSRATWWPRRATMPSCPSASPTMLRATALALIAHAWARAEAVSARPAHAGDAFHAAKRERGALLHPPAAGVRARAGAGARRLFALRPGGAGRDGMSATPLDHSKLTTLVGYVASRAALVLRKDFERSLGPLGLKVLDYSLLVLVASNAEVSQKQLGEALDISAPNMAITIDRPVERGWVERVRSTQDRAR